MSTTVPDISQNLMTKSMILLFAVAGGIAVGNLYWAQPLLAQIGGAFDVTVGSAGVAVTMTQLGYAAGVALIVPLGDVIERRRLIPLVMGLSALFLAASGFSSSFVMLLFVLGAVGLTTVAGQLLTPLAGDLASPDERGRVLGKIVAGLLTGILLSRTISGFVADAFGWRGVFWLAAAVTGMIALMLAWRLPPEPSRQPMPYMDLLKSVFSVVRRHRAVQVTLIMSSLTFAVFTMFWTGLTFLLSSAPFSYSTSTIGLVGLVGLAGAMAARKAGLLHDRGLSGKATAIALVAVVLSLLISEVGNSQIWLILASVFLIDVAIQAANVLNQTRVLAADPASRSRLNTAFVVSNFVGGASGSALAGFLWTHGGWFALNSGALVLAVVALVICLFQRHRL